MSLIAVEEDAVQHLLRLLGRQGSATALRAWVRSPGTSTYECGLSFSGTNDVRDGDLVSFHGDLELRVAPDMIPYLVDATLSLVRDGLDTRVTLEAPRAKPLEPAADAPLRERVQWVLDAEVNPELAHHNGKVVLQALSDDGILELVFGGGCQGCGLVDVTLRQGVEVKLRERCPELTMIVDATDHASGEEPFVPADGVS